MLIELCMEIQYVYLGRLCVDLGLGRFLSTAFAIVLFFLDNDAILTEVFHDFVKDMADFNYIAQISPEKKNNLSKDFFSNIGSFLRTNHIFYVFHFHQKGRNAGKTLLL